MLNAEVPREMDHDGRAVFERYRHTAPYSSCCVVDVARLTALCCRRLRRPWYRPYEADVRRLADERGLGMLGVAFVHHPMNANTFGDAEETASLVGKLERFVEMNDDKVRGLRSRWRTVTRRKESLLSRLCGGAGGVHPLLRWSWSGRHRRRLLARCSGAGAERI